MSSLWFRIENGVFHVKYSVKTHFYCLIQVKEKMLESYVTPLLMSYVNKYIKNLKPSDLQLSLWGGDVVLSKLDLKLDVLEQVLHAEYNFWFCIRHKTYWGHRKILVSSSFTFCHVLFVIMEDQN